MSMHTIDMDFDGWSMTIELDTIAAKLGEMTAERDALQAELDKRKAADLVRWYDDEQNCEQDPRSGCICAGCHTMTERAAHDWSDAPPGYHGDGS